MFQQMTYIDAYINFISVTCSPHNAKTTIGWYQRTNWQVPIVGVSLVPVTHFGKTLCGLWRCTNRAYTVSWPEVKRHTKSGCRLFLLGRAVFCISFLCLTCMYCFIFLFLIVSTSAINCLERLLQNDLLPVKWDVKLYTLTHSLCFEVHLMVQSKINSRIIISSIIIIFKHKAAGKKIEAKQCKYLRWHFMWYSLCSLESYGQVFIVTIIIITANVCLKTVLSVCCN